MNSFSETFFKMTAIKVHFKLIYLMRKFPKIGPKLQTNHFKILNIDT